MAGNTPRKALAVDEIDISVSMPHTISCTLDIARGQLTIDRMELELKGPGDLPEGCLGKICAVSGSDTLRTLTDTIVLPAIVANSTVPIGPLEVEAPAELVAGLVQWDVEFRIVDLNRREKRLYRGRPQRRSPSDGETPSAQAQRMAELRERDKKIADLQLDIVNLQEKLSRSERSIEAHAERSKVLQETADARAEEIRALNDKLATRNEQFIRLQEQYDALRHLKEEAADLRHRFEAQHHELAEQSRDLNQQRELVDQLTVERDRALQRVEDLMSEIKGLEARMSFREDQQAQFNQALDDANYKARQLERQLKESEERRDAHEHQITVLKDELQRAKSQLDHATQMIVEHDRAERGVRADLNAYVQRAETLEAERDQAIRKIDSLSTTIEGLQAEREHHKNLSSQRAISLEFEQERARKLEWDLKRLQELAQRQAETIAQHQATIEGLNAERTTADATALGLRVERDALEGRLAQQSDELTSLRQQLAERTIALETARREVAQTRDRLAKTAAGQVFFERYELIRPISSSEFGEIYKVYDRSLGRAVTLKILPAALTTDRAATAQLSTEAKLLARLDHHHTVRLYDFAIGEVPYMVTDYVEGRPLRALMQPGHPLPLREAVDYISQICKGLAHAHSQNIHHRNLSPEHLLVTDTGLVKIVDFAIAATIHASVARMTGRSPAQMLYYLAPEQIQGAREYDARTDIYALGVVCYELLSGQPPFSGEQVLDRHLHEMPPPIVGVPPGVSDVVLRCLAKRPEERFASADDVRRALRTALAQP
ncbi:MAG TPA: protein kinase [Roseiflexaceae bacterium]|nr:protein kinase [Roseiflexaceae bacterium]